MISEKLLKILVCPETHQPLTVASAAALDSLNQKITAGQIKNRAGKAVAERIDGGLIRQDGKYLYPIRKEIPVMLIDEAIPL